MVEEAQDDSRHEIPGEIDKLYREVREDVATHPAKKGQPAPKPNPILKAHWKIGRLAIDYSKLHKKVHPRGTVDWAKMLSDTLDSDLSPTWIREHSKYAGFDEYVVDHHVEEGKAWRDIRNLNPKKEARSDLDFGG